MKWLAAVALTVFVLLYLRSPIDLVPDPIRPFGLLDDLGVLLGALWWYRRRFAAAPRPGPSREAPEPRPEARDAHAVLGIARGASRAEITHAYREQMKRYHPDRVTDLGEDLQRLAHEKAIEIRRAYEELTAGAPKRS